MVDDTDRPAKLIQQAKHIINDPADIVIDSLKGLVATDPRLELDVDARGMFGS